MNDKLQGVDGFTARNVAHALDDGSQRSAARKRNMELTNMKHGEGDVKRDSTACLSAPGKAR